MASSSHGAAGRVAYRFEPMGEAPFRPIFRTENEWALELSNSTVHAVLHLGWALQEDRTYRGQMGVYVKTRGWFGPLYMALIAPFRHRIVYPALMRRLERAWKARDGSPSGAPVRP